MAKRSNRRCITKGEAVAGLEETLQQAVRLLRTGGLQHKQHNIQVGVASTLAQCLDFASTLLGHALPDGLVLGRDAIVGELRIIDPNDE